MPAGYRATQNEDGTWTVHDVPIFPQTERQLEDGEVFQFDEAWLKDAVSKAQQRLAHGYLAPLHIHHTSDPRGKVRAGFVLPKRVATFTFSDGTLPVIFADYLQVPDHVFREMEKGDLPYVSIETRDATKREISACALMPDGVPHAKFPLFTIGEAVPSGTSPRYADARGCVGSAVSFASGGGFEFAALSRFKPMARKLTSKSYDQKSRKWTFLFDDASTETRDTGGDFEFEGTAVEEPATKKAALTVKDLKDALQNVTLTVGEIGDLKAVLEAAAQAANGEQGGGGKPTPPSNNPPEAQMDEKALTTAMEAKAEAASARAELAEVKAERAKEASLAKARKALDGHVIQDGELEAIFAEGGEKGLGIYVNARTKHGRKAPVPTAGGASAVDVEMGDLPTDFEFSAEPVLRAKQIAQSKLYDQASARTKQKMTRARFIHLNTLPLAEADAALAKAK